jgi:hypothetical protein
LRSRRPTLTAARSETDFDLRVQAKRLRSGKDCDLGYIKVMENNVAKEFEEIGHSGGKITFRIVTCLREDKLNSIRSVAQFLAKYAA